MYGDMHVSSARAGDAASRTAISSTTNMGSARMETPSPRPRQHPRTGVRGRRFFAGETRRRRGVRSRGRAGLVARRFRSPISARTVRPSCAPHGTWLASRQANSGPRRDQGRCPVSRAGDGGMMRSTDDRTRHQARPYPGALAALCLAVLGLSAPAAAATTTIAGTPLTMILLDTQGGRHQIKWNGTRQVYPDNDLNGDSGISFFFNGTSYGFSGNATGGLVGANQL